jgi:hypothetical protein
MEEGSEIRHTQRLLLLYVEGSENVRKKWKENLKFFCPTKLELRAQFSHLITQVRLAGRSMTLSRSAVHGHVMPSYKFYKYMTVTKELVDDELCKVAPLSGSQCSWWCGVM